MSSADKDEDLIARVAKKDSAALRALFVTHQVKLYRFLFRFVRDEAVAEDLVNETFIKVWTKAGSFSGQSKVSTWIFTIARNEALSLLRKKSEAALDDDAATQIEDESDNQETQIAKQDKGALMRACIDKLSDAHREIVDLVYYQEKTVFEASQILDIPENTVKTRMYHARQQLSTHFKRAGIDRGWP
jgi:RNA polymerase sigma-70 factor (ECF subfamily)